nr:MAG TPA: hypothetical protein [Caudoviricetes sp.]
MRHGIKIKRRPIYQLPALLIFTALCLSADALVEHPANYAIMTVLGMEVAGNGSSEEDS